MAVQAPQRQPFRQAAGASDEWARRGIAFGGPRDGEHLVRRGFARMVQDLDAEGSPTERGVGRLRPGRDAQLDSLAEFFRIEIDHDGRSTGRVAGLQPERADLNELLARTHEFQFERAVGTRLDRRVVIAILPHVGRLGADLATADDAPASGTTRPRTVAPRVNLKSKFSSRCPGFVLIGSETALAHLRQ